jgi:hypothetical protein
LRISATSASREFEGTWGGSIVDEDYILKNTSNTYKSVGKTAKGETCDKKENGKDRKLKQPIAYLIPTAKSKKEKRNPIRVSPPVHGIRKTWCSVCTRNQ